MRPLFPGADEVVGSWGAGVWDAPSVGAGSVEAEGGAGELGNRGLIERLVRCIEDFDELVAKSWAEGVGEDCSVIVGRGGG